MKTFLLVLMSVAMGSSLFAQRADLRNTRNQALRMNLSEKQRVAALPAAEQMTWTPITLPYSEPVTYDEANCEFVEEYYFTRGFIFTLTEASTVVINGPQGLAFYRIYAEQTRENLPLAGGYAIYKELAAGTYYLETDDSGALYFEDYGGEPLTTRMEVYVTNGIYPSYTDLPYSQLLGATQAEGQLQDTLLLFPETINIVHSTSNPYYIEVEDGKSYQITGTFTGSSTTQAGGYAGGVYLLNGTLNGTTDDVIGSLFLDGDTPNSSVYTATYTGQVKVLPFTFASGISYQLSIEPMQTYLVPAALDAATAITSFPYSQTGSMEDGLLINCQDASLIGFEGLAALFNQLYYGYPFKVHLNEGDPLYITMNIDYFGVYDVGEIYLYEKSGGAYTKIGQIGFDEDEAPYLPFEAPYEMDLYIVVSNTAYFPYPSSIGLLYDLLIDNSPSGLNTVDAAGIKISNSAPDFITLSGAAGKNVGIYNSLGQRIWEQKIASDNERIAVSSWAKGIYFVKLTGNGTNLQTVKLLKK
jgi:hypothetical protein